VENAFGDRYAFALCPAQARVRSFLGSAITDMARQFRPDGLLLDSFCFLDAVHREHHELMFVSPGAFGKHLLGLCFCPACCTLLREEGIEPAAFRGRVCERVGAAVKRGATVRFAEQERDELAGLLMEWPELIVAHRARRRAVEELLQLAREIARNENVRLHNQSGLLARPSARAWTEGAGLGERAQHCDQVFVQAYFASANEAVQDLTWAATILAPERLVLSTMVAEDHVASASDLLQRVAAARAIGAAGVSYFNYGLLSADRLAWIAQANLQNP
jgi:hypothetical protein